MFEVRTDKLIASAREYFRGSMLVDKAKLQEFYDAVQGLVYAVESNDGVRQALERVKKFYE